MTDHKSHILTHHKSQILRGGITLSISCGQNIGLMLLSLRLRI